MAFIKDLAGFWTQIDDDRVLALRVLPPLINVRMPGGFERIGRRIGVENLCRCILRPSRGNLSLFEWGTVDVRMCGHAFIAVTHRSSSDDELMQEMRTTNLWVLQYTFLSLHALPVHACAGDAH
jgi:hypothetical protein